MSAKKFNPFRPGAPVPPGIFAGRLAELKQIEKSLYQTINDRAQHLLITGERAIGKTSTALYTKYVAEGELETFENEKLNLLTISATVKAKQTFEDLLLDLIFYTKNKFREDTGKTLTILKSIWEGLDEVAIASMVSFKRAIKQKNYSLSSDEFCYFIENLWDTINDSYDGVLFIVDEADRLVDFEGVASFLKALFEKFNFDGYNKISFLFCGMPSVKEELRKDHASILRNFQPIELTTMPPNEAKIVIEKAIGKTDISIGEKALNFILSLAEGYPHFLQEIGFSAFEVNSDAVIDVDDVAKGVKGSADYPGSSERLGRQYFDKMYKRDVKSDIYREILTIVAREKEQFVTRAEILKKFSKGKTALGSYLTNLVNRELLVKDETRRGYYTLPSHMFRVYIRLRSKIK